MSNKSFIYTDDTNTKDTLLSLGYTLINSDLKNNVFIFINNKPDKLTTYKNYADLKIAETNILTF